MYAALAAIVGIAIVVVGGGGIKTMFRRWDAVADRYDEEKPKVTAAVRAAPSVSGQAAQYAPSTQGRTPRHGATAASQYSTGDSHGPLPENPIPVSTEDQEPMRAVNGAARITLILCPVPELAEAEFRTGGRN